MSSVDTKGFRKEINNQPFVAGLQRRPSTGIGQIRSLRKNSSYIKPEPEYTLPEGDSERGAKLFKNKCQVGVIERYIYKYLITTSSFPFSF